MQKCIGGINFIGGDVPGFYGDPVHQDNPFIETVEEFTYVDKVKKQKVISEKIIKKPNWDKALIKDWYRLGAFMPFFRAHSHFDGHPREPYCFPNDVKDNLREIMQMRYKLLIYLYT